MRKVSTAYVMYFNKKYSKTGSLFEGKFKSRHIGEENYFNYIFSYVHLNPIKLIQHDWKENGILDRNKASEFLNKYKYSSFQDYFGFERREGRVLDKNSIPEYFLCNNLKELFKWITSNT
jgi:putative transposase